MVIRDQNYERILQEEAVPTHTGTSELVMLSKENARLKALLRRLEWCIDIAATGPYAFCPICRQERKAGHAEDCELAQALGEGE